MPRGLHARLCHAFLVTIILIIELAEVIGGDAHEGDSGCDRDDERRTGWRRGGRRWWTGGRWGRRLNGVDTALSDWPTSYNGLNCSYRLSDGGLETVAVVSHWLLEPDDRRLTFMSNKIFACFACLLATSTDFGPVAEWQQQNVLATSLSALQFRPRKHCSLTNTIPTRTTLWYASCRF